MHLLRNRTFPLLVVTALLTPCAAACAQQDPDVTVVIKAKSKPAVLPTLLVMCDLLCNWKLDGEVRGHIDAGGSAKVKVESGQHMVEAATEDGIDQVKQPCTVNPTGQTMVSIEFQPIRDARLMAGQEATDKASQDAEAETQRKLREEAEREARDKAARWRAAKEEEERRPWTDPATGLMWTRKDNGSDVSWLQAMDYCKSLRLEGHHDWRLPTADELHGVSAPNISGVYLRGNLQLSGWAWSGFQVSGKKGKANGQAWAIDPSSFGNGLYSVPLDGHGYEIRALCVREQ